MGSVQSGVQMPSGRDVDGQGSAYRWAVLAILLSTFTVSYLDRLNWTVAMPLVVSELRWGMTQGGALMSGFYLGYVVTQIPGGALADRFGPQRILALSVASMGILTILTPLVPTFWGMMVFRFLTGLGAGPVFACGVKYQSQWFPRRERAIAMSIFNQGGSLGPLLVSGILPVIVTRGNWRYAFTIPGIATLAVACLVLLGAPAKPPAGRDSASSPRSPAAPVQERPLDSRNFAVACVADFLRTGPAMGFVTWTVTYLMRDRALSAVAAGAVMSGYSAAAVCGGLLSGLVSDRLAKGRRKVVSFGALVGSATSMALLGMSGGYGSAMAVIILIACGITHGMVSPPLNTLVSELLAGSKREGRLLGLYNMSGQCGSLIFPVLLGWILDTTGSFRILYLAAAGSCLLAALAVYTLREQQ